MQCNIGKHTISIFDNNYCQTIQKWMNIWSWSPPSFISSCASTHPPCTGVEINVRLRQKPAKFAGNLAKIRLKPLLWHSWNLLYLKGVRTFQKLSQFQGVRNFLLERGDKAEKGSWGKIWGLSLFYYFTVQLHLKCMWEY